MLGMHQQHELVAANRDLEEPGFGRMKRERAEIEAALLHFHRDLARRDAADIDRERPARRRFSSCENGSELWLRWIDRHHILSPQATFTPAKPDKPKRARNS